MRSEGGKLVRRGLIALAAMGLIGAGTAAQGGVAAGNADAVKGKAIFARCAACHAVAPGAPARIGPNLNAVVGRKSASVPGFAYSPAMRKAALRWDEATLNRFITKPAAVVPGTTMGFAGIADPAERKALIAYLRKPVG